MKKIALLLSIMLSTCNIVCAQGIFDNLFGGGVKKEISSNVEEAYQSFIGISEMGSPEQIMRQNNFALLCEIGNMPQSYGSACFLKANGSYNHADTAEYYLEKAVIKAAKSNNDKLAKDLSEVKQFAQKIKEYANLARNTPNLEKFNDYMDEVLRLTRNATKSVRTLRITHKL